MTQEERKPAEGMLMWGAGSRHGLSPAGDPLRDCRTHIRFPKSKEVGLFTDQLTPLVGGCSQPGHQIPGTLGLPCEGWACACGLRKFSGRDNSCLMYKATGISMNCTR